MIGETNNIFKVLIFKLMFVFALCALTNNLYSQKRFEHLTIKDGLTNNSISNIIQSEDGFLWFGTLNGLSRYDGKEIRNYSYEPGNQNSLSSNRIYYLFEDGWNYIWILTYEFQVLRFDPQTERFININLQLPAGILQGQNRVDVYSSSPSIIWIASGDGGIIRVKQQKGTEDFTIDYFVDGENAPSVEETFIYKDSRSRLWIGTHQGLMLLDNDTAQFSELIAKNKHIVNASHLFTSCLEGDDGSIILGTADQGLFEYQGGHLTKWHILPDPNLFIQDIKKSEKGDIVVTTKGNGFYHISPDYLVQNYSSSRIKDYNKIYCDHTGTFWLRTPIRGMSMFNPATKVSRHYDLNSGMRESQGDPDKPRFLEDSKGTVWIGIYGGGLCKFNREIGEFEYFHHQKSNSSSLSSNFVLTLFEDQSEDLWIGTYKSGLNKLDLTESKLQYKDLVKNALYESQNEVRCITEDDKERIWIGTKYGDIYCCDKNNNILFTIPDDLSNKADYHRNNVYALLTDGNDLWVGTKGNGLCCIKNVLDFDKDRSKRFGIDVYKYNENDSTSIPSNDVFSLLQDQYGQIWVGTYHGGLSVIKNPNVAIQFKTFTANPADSASLSDNRIRKIYRDRNNNLWIGTVTGLNLLESKYLISDIKRFRCFYKDPTTANSLANNDIFDIHQDLDGTIWVGTYGGGLNGIELDADTVIFSHYFRKDGLPSDIVFSILEDDHLNLWLGTDNGIGKFSAKTHTSELVDNEDGYGHGVFSEGCKYKSSTREFLYGTQNGFIRFHPDSINLKKKSYPIVLTGFQLFNEIVVPGAQNSPLKVSINNTDELKLKYNQNFIGIDFAVMDFKYPDKIQYSYILENYDKNWNKALFNTNANYKALPPGKYIFKLKATDSRGNLLHDTRELTIIISPPLWRTTGAIVLYYLLLVAIIYFVLKEVRTRNRIKFDNKLSEEKFQFFTNVSHEFKTPLTLINNSIDDIDSATTFTKDVRAGIQLIKRNVQSLNTLIEQLISFRRIQRGVMDLRVRKIEIISYLNDIYLSFLPYAEKKELKFIFDTNLESYEGMLDVRYTDVIINNLLSNAFKHTPSHKKVFFKVNIDTHNERLIIQVQDQGEGISQEYVDKIFDRFVFVENSIYSSFKGSGIGLSLSRELLFLHKGKVDLQSKLKEGSTFTIELPVGEKYYDEKEKTVCDEVSVIQQPQPFYSDIDYTTDEQPVVQHKKAANAVKFKLLVIEDNQELREYLTDKLQKDNTVFVATNGEEGVELAKEVNPDLIITDLKMPKLDGIELTKQLKSDFETSHIPIILLTAKSSIESKIEGIDSGADDYITKPFNMEYLKRRIVNIISQRKQLKEKFAKDPGFKPEKLTTSNSDQKFLSKVIELIEINIKVSNYTIDDIIVELGYSRSVFFKKMKSVSGYPPKEFVRIIKMKKAAEYLRDPGASVSEVSYNVGFNDPDYFRKSFKNFFGETPTSYQKKYK